MGTTEQRSTHRPSSSENGARALRKQHQQRKKVVAARWLSLILRHVCIYYNWLSYSLIFHSIISNLPPTYSRNTTDERNVFLHDNQTFIRLISDTSVLSWHDNFRVFLSFEMPLLLEENVYWIHLTPRPHCPHTLVLTLLRLYTNVWAQFYIEHVMCASDVYKHLVLTMST